MSTLIEKKAAKSYTCSDNPDPVDVHVGMRLRMQRNLIGLSQEQLGQSLGLTFQQIQKYERGRNRMGSSRLFQIANTLSVPVAYFFEGLPSVMRQRTQLPVADQSQAQPDNMAQQDDYDILRRRETLELVRAYYRIQDIKQRRKIYELVRSMSDQNQK